MIRKKFKYIILDYGDVLAYPATGNWFITTNFFELINKEKIDIDKFNNAVSKASSIISKKMITELDEEKAFIEVYKVILSDLNLDVDIDDVSKKLAFDFVYSDTKHLLYKEVKESLERLSHDYKLILLSDNWPCAYRLLKKWCILDYFEKVYISSEYEMLKKDKIFFDLPIKEFSINNGEALFIDDKEYLLDIAKEKGLEVLLMDRTCEKQDSKYKIITSLIELD